MYFIQFYAIILQLLQKCYVLLRRYNSRVTIFCQPQHFLFFLSRTFQTAPKQTVHHGLTNFQFFEKKFDFSGDLRTKKLRFISRSGGKFIFSLDFKHLLCQPELAGILCQFYYIFFIFLSHYVNRFSSINNGIPHGKWVIYFSL